MKPSAKLLGAIFGRHQRTEAGIKARVEQTQTNIAQEVAAGLKLVILDAADHRFQF